jgi:NADPH:quinone reductase-like Zn-dependent oxidoreductase
VAHQHGGYAEQVATEPRALAPKPAHLCCSTNSTR